MVFANLKNLKQMIEIASKLSEEFEFVRVDLYNIDGKIYFGEITFFHRGGINPAITPVRFEEEIGKSINIDNLQIQ